MTISVKDIAWLAGLLEGEGCFCGASNRPHRPAIQLAMTDVDIVRRAGRILGSRIGGPYFHKQKRLDGGNRKSFYRCGVSGHFAAAWMMTLYPLLGERRKNKIKELLEIWKSSFVEKRRAPRAPNGARTPAKCHPSNAVVGDGLCKRCYRKRRTERGL